MSIFSWSSNPKTLSAWNRQCRSEERGAVTFTLNGHTHRKGKPAIITTHAEYWFNLGVKHRDDGPAVTIFPDHKEWWVNGRRHRIGNPAVVGTNTDDSSKYEFWYELGELHRLDGPAVIQSNKPPEWWYKGVRVKVDSQEQYQQWIEKHQGDDTNNEHF